MAKSSSHLRLLIVALFLVSKSSSFDTPPYNNHHGSALENSDSSLEWHGVDYYYNMESWNLNSSEEYSDEAYDDFDENSHHPQEPITIGTPTNTNASSSVLVEEKGQDKNETVAVPPTEQSNETSENEVSSEVSDKGGIDLQWASSATGTSKNETDKMIKEKAVEEEYDDAIEYWDQDGGSDDDEYHIEENNSKPATELLKEIPTDNDEGAEKRFNPEKYQDLETLHQIQDIILGEWTVLYADTNLPCIMFKGKISLVVPVSPSWSNKEYVELDVPYDAEASGSCNSLNNDYQEMVLRWNVTERNKTYENTVYLGFGTNWTSEFSDLKVAEDQYALVAVTAAYYNGEVSEEGEENSGDQGLVSYSVSDLTEFMTPVNHSMSCFKEKSILLGRMQLTFTDIQFEAFRPNLETLPFGDFMNSVLCATDEILVFDAVMTFIIWFWIGALFVVLVIFVVLLSLSYRRKAAQDGFGYKVLSA